MYNVGKCAVLVPKGYML